MKRHLVVGGSGMVGRNLLQVITELGLNGVGTYFKNPLPGLKFLDVRQKRKVDVLFRETLPQIVYLPASLTNVDYCELHPTESYETNVRGVVNVVHCANAIGAKVVYFSSDYIFDGTSGPYGEWDPASPLSEYGRHKLIAEHYVSLHAVQYLIVRTTVVYGPEKQRKNFIHRLLDNLSSGVEIRVPFDQIGSPTYAPNLAMAVMELVRQECCGVFHVAGPDLVSRYDLAREAAEVFGLDRDLIKPVRTSDLRQSATRPLAAGMRVDKAMSRLPAALLGYRSGLQELRRWELAG